MINKIAMGVPCRYMRWDERKKRMMPSVPAVDCGIDCNNCGWNPEEKTRRLETGVICKHNETLSLHFIGKDDKND